MLLLFFSFLPLTFTCCGKGSYLKLIDEQGVVVGMETGAVSSQLFHWNGLPWWWALRNDRYCNNITRQKIYVYKAQDPWLSISNPQNREPILGLPTLDRPKNHTDASCLFLSDLLTCRLYLNNSTVRSNRPGLFIVPPTNVCWNIVKITWKASRMFLLCNRVMSLSYDIIMPTTMSRTTQELKGHKSHLILQ